MTKEKELLKRFLKLKEDERKLEEDIDKFLNKKDEPVEDFFA